MHYFQAKICSSTARLQSNNFSSSKMFSRCLQDILPASSRQKIVTLGVGGGNLFLHLEITLPFSKLCYAFEKNFLPPQFYEKRPF